MLEIIVLFFLTRYIGKLAISKGLNPGTWKLFTVLAWFGAETTGIIAGVALFGTSELFGLAALGMVCGVGSFLIIKASLLKRPDNMEDDINKIGVRDLYP